MANDPGQPDSATPAETIIEIEDTPEARALFEASEEDKQILASVEGSEARPPAVASPAVAAAPAAAAAVPVAAVDPAQAAQERHRRRLLAEVETDLDAVEAARAARPARAVEPTPARPVDIDLSDADWDKVLRDAKAAADGSESYGDAVERGLKVLRDASKARRKEAEETAAARAPEARLQALIDVQIDQAMKDIPDWNDVVTKSGILADIIPAKKGEPVRDPRLHARIYGAPNVAEAAYMYGLGRLARAEGRTLEDALAERNLFGMSKPATALAAPASAAAPAAAAPAKSAAEIARDAERAAVAQAAKPLVKAKGLRQFAEAGAPTMRLTSAMLERAMDQKPEEFLKWAETHRDEDRAFMSGELSAVNQP